MAREHRIPPDRSAWGASGELEERLRLQTREILEAAARSNAAPGSLERKVGDFYASAMDEAAAESKGVAPLKPALSRIAALKTKADLATYLGEELRADVDAMDCTSFQTSRLFGLWVAPDLATPTRSVPYLLQGGLGMPDREYYLSTAPTMVETRDKYRAHVETILTLAGIKDAAKRAARVVDLETKMAQVHATRLESLEVKNANNPWPRAEWAKRAPGLDWTRFFQAAGLAGQPVVVPWHPKATAGLSALVAHEPLEAWMDWATYHAVDRRSAFLGKAFQDEAFAFYGSVLSGTAEQPARWKRAQNWIDDVVGEAVGRLFVERHFTPQAKAKASEMVKSIAAAFVRRIDALDWMAPSTKVEAKAKVQALYVGVGYPDRWEDWSGLEVRARQSRRQRGPRRSSSHRQQELAKLGKPVDRRAWCMAPARGQRGEPAGAQRAEHPGRHPPAALLRARRAGGGQLRRPSAGTVGHEISHSFDNQGSLFDSDRQAPELVDEGGPGALPGLRYAAGRGSSTATGPSPTCT